VIGDSHNDIIKGNPSSIYIGYRHVTNWITIDGVFFPTQTADFASKYLYVAIIRPIYYTSSCDRGNLVFQLFDVQYTRTFEL